MAMVLMCALPQMRGQNGLPAESRVLDGYSESECRSRLSQRPLQGLEGIWYYPEERMTLCIESTTDDVSQQGLTYRIVLIESGSGDVLPGTVIGYAQESVSDRKWRLWLYSERDVLTLRHSVECVATTNDDMSQLTFEKPSIKLKFRVNFARFLPTLFRGISISTENKKEKLPLGFKKIYPLNSGTNRVRYL